MRVAGHDYIFDKSKMENLIAIIDETGSDDMKLCTLEMLMDGHLCRETAELKVSKMKPTNLYINDKLWHSDGKEPMLSFMSMAGLTAQVCYEMVIKASDAARLKAKETGAEYYPIPDKTNIWDCYYIMAMMNSDYWLSHGDQQKLAELAYQYLSDPDR